MNSDPWWLGLLTTSIGSLLGTLGAATIAVLTVRRSESASAAATRERTYIEAADGAAEAIGKLRRECRASWYKMDWDAGREALDDYDQWLRGNEPKLRYSGLFQVAEFVREHSEVYHSNWGVIATAVAGRRIRATNTEMFNLPVQGRFEWALYSGLGLLGSLARDGTTLSTQGVPDPYKLYGIPDVTTPENRTHIEKTLELVMNLSEEVSGRSAPGPGNSHEPQAQGQRK